MPAVIRKQIEELTDEELAALDSAFPPDSQNLLNDVVANLAFLDYKPEDHEVAGEEPLPMSAPYDRELHM